jgi:hypothetical protein
LTIIGVGPSGSTYSAAGNSDATLSFYGPTYDVSLKGTDTTNGSMIARSFSVSGGGNGGFHYDQSLANGGSISGWEVASYMDDSRMDPQ